MDEKSRLYFRINEVRQPFGTFLAWLKRKTLLNVSLYNHTKSLLNKKPLSEAENRQTGERTWQKIWVSWWLNNKEIRNVYKKHVFSLTIETIKTKRTKNHTSDEQNVFLYDSGLNMHVGQDFASK